MDNGVKENGVERLKTRFLQQTWLEPGEALRIVGSCVELGEWEAERGVEMGLVGIPGSRRMSATGEVCGYLNGAQYKYVVVRFEEREEEITEDEAGGDHAKDEVGEMGEKREETVGEEQDQVMEMGEERKENLGTDEEQERVAGRRIVVVQPVVHVVRWIPPDPKGNLVVNASVMDDREVGLFFKMYKTLTTDQNLYVYGSSKSLGSWDRANAVELGWHENHRWSRDLVVPRSEILEGGPVEYKFFVAPYGEPGCTSEAREIETVNNRTIDTSEEQLDRDGCIEIYNAWNGIIMRLMIYHPLPEGRAMAVVGGHEQIGNWSGPRGMGLGPERRLLTGEIGRCWEVTFPLTEQEFKQNVQYRYVSLDQNDLTGIFEREPNRVRDFPNVGEISRGMNIAFDANFVGGIDFDEIADWNVVIGPYPQSKEDVDIMAQADVRAVVNVQTDGDFEKRKIDWAAISRAYEEHDIWVGRIQIIDFDGEDLQRHLKRAVEELHHFICHGRKTYVHCTAGMGRAPAVVVGYAVKYRGMDADAALAYIKQYRKVAAPNMSAIHQAIRDQRI